MLERAETAELVGATLSSLPPDYRDALTAKYVDGLSVREIGSRTGRGEKAAESLLTRARSRQLSPSVGQQCEDLAEG